MSEAIESVKIIWIDEEIRLKLYELEWADCPYWLQKQVQKIDAVFARDTRAKFQRIGMAHTVRLQAVMEAIQNSDKTAIDRLAAVVPTVEDSDIIISYWYQNLTHYAAVYNKLIGLQIGDVYVDPTEEWRIIVNGKIRY